MPRPHRSSRAWVRGSLGHGDLLVRVTTGTEHVGPRSIASLGPFARAALAEAATRLVSVGPSVGTLSNSEARKVAARRLVPHLGADPLGDGVEKGFADFRFQSTVQRGRTEKISKAGPVEPLHDRVPLH